MKYQILFSGKNKKNEPAHDKTYNKICLTSDDSDQPLHPSSLIRVPSLCAFFSFQAIQRRINENPCHTVWMYRLI